jgi:hypothetical protein
MTFFMSKSTLLQLTQLQMSVLKDKINALLTKHGIKLSVENAAIDLKAEAALADGTMVYTTAAGFEAGADCFTKNEAGDAIPCPEGEYAMADGTMIVVDAEGKIAEVKAAEEVPAEMSTEEVSTIIDSLATRVTDLESKLSAVTIERDSANLKFSEMQKDFTAEKTLRAKFEKAAAAVSVTATVVPIELKKESKSSDMSEFMDGIRAKANQAN